MRSQQIARDIDGYLQTIDSPPPGGRRAHPLGTSKPGGNSSGAKLNAVGNSPSEFCDRLLPTPVGRRRSVMSRLCKSGTCTRRWSAFGTARWRLQPGVETLTNVATTYIYLGRYGDARNYLNQTIRINPSYEYAYYRMAMSWGSREPPVKGLSMFSINTRNPVKIKEFRDLFQKYQVPLPE